MTSEQIGKIAMIFLSFRDHLKIYHWQTKNYARHKAADKLVVTMTTQIDRFMETLQGSRDMRLKLVAPDNSITVEDLSDKNIMKVLKAFKEWLTTGLEPIFGSIHLWESKPYFFVQS